MNRSLRRVLLLSSAGCLAAAGAALVPTAPATARACAVATVYVSGSGTPAGGCVPVFDQWLDSCAGTTNTVGGTGAGVVVCIPSPV